MAIIVLSSAATGIGLGDFTVNLLPEGETIQSGIAGLFSTSARNIDVVIGGNVFAATSGVVLSTAVATNEENSITVLDTGVVVVESIHALEADGNEASIVNH